jgi:nucleoside 2-deoxyribosyltransferase
MAIILTPLLRQSLELPMPESFASVYLAGPMVFYPDPASVFTRMKHICSAHGLLGLAPLDNQIDLQGLPPGKELLRRIVKADIDLMNRVGAGLFCLDGFRRSPEMDPGTAFEIGWMAAHGKPMAGWTRDPRSYEQRVEDHFRDTFGQKLAESLPSEHGAVSGSRRDPDGVLVHSQGCMQNGMVHIGIELQGGEVFADADWEVAFSNAVSHLAERLRS